MLLVVCIYIPYRPTQIFTSEGVCRECHSPILTNVEYIIAPGLRRHLTRGIGWSEKPIERHAEEAGVHTA
jgi:hypothetical protein